MARLSDDNEVTQADAARALGTLAYNNTENQGAIVAADAVRPLVQLLSSGSTRVQCEAARALAGLAKECQDIKEAAQEAGSQIKIREIRYIEHVEDPEAFPPDVLESYKKQAEEADAWERKVEEEQARRAVPLVRLKQIRRANLDAIAAAGAIRPLVQLLSSGSADVQLIALTALGNLADDHDGNCAAIAAPRLGRLKSLTRPTTSRTQGMGPTSRRKLRYGG